MYWLRYPILVLLLIPFVYADSAIQTDWSGGPGIWGPVLDWSNEFYFDTNVEWDCIPGDIVLPLVIAEHAVDWNVMGVYSIYSEDIDGDGDMDVLGAAESPGNKISWWENENGLGTSWVEHVVISGFWGARSVYAEDIDGDGDMDILGAAETEDDITWWENLNGSGTSWAEHTVDGDFNGAVSVYSADFNGDGDMDILGAASADDDITWWENLNGSGTSWTQHTIDGDYSSASFVYSEDIDGDSDMDVLGAAYNADNITWWENVDGSGTSWTENTIDGEFGGVGSVYAKDVNGDGDMDVLGAAYWDNDITWWENIDGSGTSWIEHTVDGDFNYACCVHSEDMDEDGDMDILGAAIFYNNITWWENLDGSGTSWTGHTVDGSFMQAWSVYSGDIDGDGSMDVLGAAWMYGEIYWWDLTPSGWLESSILDTEEDPDWDYFEWNSQTPPETSVSFQIRASDDHASMGAWSDTLLVPCLLEGILEDGDQYVQYRVILETSDPDTTPALFDVMLTWDPMGIEGGEDPAILALLPFSPNPSSLPAVRFSLTEPASVELSIFDLSGRLISEIHGDDYSPGYHDVLLGDLSPGVYFCRMISGDFAAAQRFIVIK